MFPSALWRWQLGFGWEDHKSIQRQCLWCCPHDHSHCKSSLCSFDECRLSTGWPPTLRPSQPTWDVSPPINGCYHPHPSSPKADTYFTVPQRVEGCVDLGTARRVPIPCPRLYIAAAVMLNNWLQPLKPQSIMPSLNHCELLRHVGVNNLPKVVTRHLNWIELAAFELPVQCLNH